jgi:hypothetical protein
MGIDDIFKDFSWSQLAIFAAFALPGFISLQVWSLITPTTERTLLDQLPEAIGFGVLNAAVAAPGALLWGTHNPVTLYIIVLVSLVLLPALWPFALRWLLEQLTRLGWILGQEHSGWDAAFLRRQPYLSSCTCRMAASWAGITAITLMPVCIPPQATYILRRCGRLTRMESFMAGSRARAALFYAPKTTASSNCLLPNRGQNGER